MTICGFDHGYHGPISVREALSVFWDSLGDRGRTFCEQLRTSNMTATRSSSIVSLA